jgi:glycine/D-amino acid oxidase-like deaminating enzyme
MKITSNTTYWPKKNAFDRSYPSLSSDLETDILIIGSGITGALIAYKLISEGKKVVLVDKRDVCNGSTAASTAMLQYEIDVPLHQLIRQRGLTCAVSSYKNCEKTIFNLKKIVNTLKSDCQFEFKKSIYFTSSKKDIDFLQKEFQTRKEHGFNVKWLEKKDIENIGFKGLAAIESESGAVMDPYRLAMDLLKFCHKKKMEIFDRTEIVKIDEKNDLLIAYTKEGQKITTNHIIHCTGYESTQNLEEKVVQLKSTYAIVSEAFETIPNVFKNHIYWDTSSPYLYFRGTKDGRILMGGGDADFKNSQKRDVLLPKKEKYLIKQFKKCFPDINFKTDYSWAGTFGETEDGLPYFGKPDLKKNEHYILGFGGNGITFSVLGMDVIVDSLHDKPNPLLDYYKFNR